MKNAYAATGWVAAVAVFIVAANPTGSVFLATRSGSIGTVPQLWLLAVVALVVIGAISLATGRLLRRALNRTDATPGRAKADAWVAFYVGAVIIVIGTYAIPVGMLSIMVNSDRSLQDNVTWFFVTWIVLHLTIGAIAYLLGRLAYGRDPRPTAEPTATSWPPL